MSDTVENHSTEADAIADLATQAVGTELLSEGTIVALADGGGKVKVVDLEQYADHPRRAKATRVVNDAASFNAYVNKHAPFGSAEVWADTRRSTVIGILDAHEAAEPSWEQHRAQLVLEKTPAWLAWEKIDGEFMPQLAFAEFIDLRAIDVRDPNPLELIELAQFFQAHRKIEFKSSQRIDNGQTQLEYIEEVTASGQKRDKSGDLKIPENILLAIKPYIGGPIYYVNARFRYRIGEAGVLLLGVALERPQEILDAAFADIVKVIREGKPATEARAATATEPAVDPAAEVPAVLADIYYGRPAQS